MDENIERAELHIHTKASKNQWSTIDILDAFKRAKELNLSSIAICDYKSVDAYSEIMNIDDENKSGIKIIFGAELPFESTTQAINTKGYSLTLLAKNRAGINALKELTSTLTAVDKNGACELLNPHLLMKNRENLLIGSTSYRGEIFNEIKWWWDGVKDYRKMAEFYDFFEISPSSDKEDKSINERIIELSKICNIPVIATSCARYCEQICPIEEMIEEFSYLGEDIAYDIVIKNPNKLAELINY